MTPVIFFSAVFAVLLSPPTLAADPAHGIAMHGQPALAAGFPHLPYANPQAPKGGVIKLGQIGSFDSLNPFIVQGVAAYGIRENIYESLLGRSADEPFSLYGLLARSIEVPEDRGSITFHLDPDARFSDGRPVTADDVLFSWALLKEPLPSSASILRPFRNSRIKLRRGWRHG